MQNTGLKILVHASAFFAPLLVPFIVFIITGDKEVKKLSIQALLFQLVMWGLIFVSTILSFILIGIPLLILFSIVGIIVPVLGIINALNGEEFNYPIVGLWYR